MRLLPIIILTVTLSMTYHHHLSAQPSTIPFTSTSAISFSTTSQPLTITGFTASIKQNKVILNWTVGENQEATQFEVQRSTDGKLFKTVALVFATGKKDVDQYEFYEKATAKKVTYRIKAVSKDQAIQYSDAIAAQEEKN